MNASIEANEPAANVLDVGKQRFARFAAFDGIRAIAVVFVCYGHATRTALGAALGEVGVNVFFVLSGYLITSILLKTRERTGRIDLRSFYTRRFWRILPPYYLYLGAIALAAAVGWVKIAPLAFLYDAFFLKNYSFAIPGDWWTGHSWSLAVEEQFYLFWPLVLILGGAKLGWRFALSAILAAPLVRVGIYEFLPAYRPYLGVMLPTRIDMIMLGCALALAIARGPEFLAWLTQERSRRIVTAFVVIVVAGFALQLRFRGAYLFTVGMTLQGLAGAAIIAHLVRFPDNSLAKLLGVAPLAWVGRISYSIFLWQQPFLTPQLNTSITGRFPFNIICIFALAIASYYLVERPLIRTLPAAKTTPRPLTVPLT